MQNILVQLDTDEIPGTYDTLVAYDGGADQVVRVGGVTPENVASLVDGVIHARAMAARQHVALLISGRDLDVGHAVLGVVQARFFAEFRVSVMLDSSGCNTTAAAAVALVMQRGSLSGKRAVVLAGTGPVGQRMAVLLAREGADVVLTSRKLVGAEAACASMENEFGVSLTPMQVSTAENAQIALENAQIVFGAGKAGIQLLTAQHWQNHPTIEILLDTNTEQPPGFEGIEITDREVDRHGKTVFGGLGLGTFKLALHRACIAQLFTQNDQILDADLIFNLAKTRL